MKGLHVRMRVFSGVRDPEWVIQNPADETRVRRWFATATRRAPVSADGVAAGPPVTGFRGFDVTLDGQTIHVYRNRLVSPAAVFDARETIDDILFDTNAQVLEHEFGLTAEMMRSDATHLIDGLPATCDTSNAELGSAQYRPSSWVPEPFRGNTCYGYAANVRTSLVVTPDDSGRQSWSKSELRNALTDDGAGSAIIGIPSAPLHLPDRHYMVALVQPLLNGRGDFHFLRLDRSGCWSQKVSTAAVKQIDDQQQKITNLCTARFRAQYVFVGFFVVNEDLRDLLRERGQA